MSRVAGVRMQVWSRCIS